MKEPRCFYCSKRHWGECVRGMTGSERMKKRQTENRAEYNEYMKKYMREYRAQGRDKVEGRRI